MWSGTTARVPVDVYKRQVINGFHFAAVGNDHIDARLQTQLGGVELGGHAAGAPPGACAACHGPQLRCDRLHMVDELCLGMAAGVSIIQTVNVTEQDQQIGPARCV